MVDRATESGNRRREGSVTGRLAKKLLTPIAATAAGALAKYAARKAPQLLEEVVLPKLRAAQKGGGSVVQDLPAQARAAAGEVGDLAKDLAGRVSGGDSTAEPRRLSKTQLEQRREARAERRATRRKASTT